MKTTVELPEALKKMTARAKPRKRSRLPVIKRRGRSALPDLTAEYKARLEEEADIAKLRRSFGR